MASDDGWVIRSSGKAPQLLLPALDRCQADRCCCGWKLQRPRRRNCGFTIAGRRKGITRSRSSTGSLLSAGRNVLYLSIDVPDLAGRLRLEPGRCPGQFVLHGLELRTPQPEPKYDFEDMPSTD